MTPAERGRIIKEARIAKKMTQSEVVGSFITRNMLSQIESGNATPSVKTLEYLAQTLDIPVSELMPGSDEVSCSGQGAGASCLDNDPEILYNIGNGQIADEGDAYMSKQALCMQYKFIVALLECGNADKVIEILKGEIDRIDNGEAAGGSDGKNNN